MDKSQSPSDPNRQFLKEFQALYGLSDGTKETLLTQLRVDRTISQTTTPKQWSNKNESRD
jgi:hypothetical protein